MNKKILFKLIFCCVLLFLFIKTSNARAGWSPMESGVTEYSVKGIWGSSATDVFAVGAQETILHFDGNQQGIWTAMQNDVSS